MRDDEFNKVYRKLVPQLHKYFHTCLKNEQYPFPYDGIKKTLTSLTGHEAYYNSRKESLSGYSIEALIWTKAGNIWYEFIHPRKTKIDGIEAGKSLRSTDPDPLHLILVREQLRLIKDRVEPETWKIIEMRADGLSFTQIAETLDENEGKLKMKMHRLKKRLEEESLRFL